MAKRKAKRGSLVELSALEAERTGFLYAKVVRVDPDGDVFVVGQASGAHWFMAPDSYRVVKP